ncbi:MAG: DUF805 domain-containing protein [Rhizomicrobium sp.]
MLARTSNSAGGQMGFGQAISTCFRKYAVFRGRAARSEYWYFVLFGALLEIPAGIADAVIAGSGQNGGQPVSGLISLVLFLPRISVAVRRLHDVNRSGWVLGGLFLYILVAGAMLGFYIYSLGGATPSFAGPIGIVGIVLFLGLFAWLVYLFVLSVVKGTTGPNAYGEDPLGPDVNVFQ